MSTENISDKRKIYDAANGRCELCGRKIEFEEMTVDQIIPLGRGGMDEFNNYFKKGGVLKFDGGGYLSRNAKQYNKNISNGMPFGYWPTNITKHQIKLANSSDNKDHENEIVVKASCEKGAFRGANTLAKLIVKNELKEGALTDFPLFKKRGYIEGFYGPTWENSKRLSVMRLMASYGMNTFFYAPKDDIYHREKWRELYPEKELKELKKMLK